jgi:CsoR family transcriptional regulator, copper-sensing transcriptional repressor
MCAGGDIGNRLRRIEGQVSGIRRMREEGRYCIEVLDQVAAVRAGLEAVALLILEEHVDGCVSQAVEQGEGHAKAVELLSAVRRYVRTR